MNDSPAFSLMMFVMLWLVIVFLSFSLKHDVNQLAGQIGCRWESPTFGHSSRLTCPAIAEGEAK